MKCSINMKSINNPVIIVSLVLIISNGCRTAIENKTEFQLEDILKSYIDTNFLYEESWDYTTRIGREPLKDSADEKIYFKNRLQVYKGMEILQLHPLDNPIHPERIAFLDSVLKQEGLTLKDSVLRYHKYDLNRKTEKYFISMTDSVYEFNHVSSDSAIFCIYNFSHIIQQGPDRAYFFYEFMRRVKHAAGYMVILKKEKDSHKWKVEKRILIWIS